MNLFTDFILGVIWLTYTPIQGSRECIDTIKKIGKKVTFVTNNAATTRIKTELKLNKFDDTTEVLNPLFAIIQYLKSINFDKMLYVISNAGFKQELKNSGFSLLPDPVS